MPVLMPSADVLAEREGALGIIRLNRPKALNALTLEMIRAIKSAFDDFAARDEVRMVLLTSAQPGIFCAGADIKALRQARLAQDHALVDDFFIEEFALDRAIADYPKPVIALMDGICMGGGLGLSIYAPYRIVTARSVLAMPETAIGHFPDVGASWFLNQMPGQIGGYLGLTGARLNAADALYSGAATHFVAAESLPDLVTALSNTPVSDLPALFSDSAQPTPSALQENQDAINRCFGAENLEGVFTRLRAERSTFAQAALAALDAASPESLRITFALLHRMQGASLPECLAEELALALQVTRSPDFLEGVRAMVVDKDRHPIWSSPRIS